MELVYYRAPNGNFGDDLNAFLWDRLLPEKVRRSERLILIGIGSILNERMVGRYGQCGRSVAVLGAGASYGPVPRNMDGWTVSALRGPLTAAAIGRPEAAITDGAALLAATDLVPQRKGEGRILFMPHHGSVDTGDWPAVARLADVDYLDPRGSVPELLVQFAHAKLVLAEAMHAAIVADTLRIPWIPIITSPAADRFKWVDWTSSLELPFMPVQIGASTVGEMLRLRRARQLVRSLGGGSATFSGCEREPVFLRHYLEMRFRDGDPASRQASSARRHAGLRKRLKAAAKTFDGVFTTRAAIALRRAKGSTSYLSSDTVFANRLARLWEAVQSLERIA